MNIFFLITIMDSTKKKKKKKKKKILKKNEDILDALKENHVIRKVLNLCKDNNITFYFRK